MFFQIDIFVFILYSYRKFVKTISLCILEKKVSNFTLKMIVFAFVSISLFSSSTDCMMHPGLTRTAEWELVTEEEKPSALSDAVKNLNRGTSVTLDQKLLSDPFLKSWLEPLYNSSPNMVIGKVSLSSNNEVAIFSKRIVKNNKRHIINNKRRVVNNKWFVQFWDRVKNKPLGEDFVVEQGFFVDELELSSSGKIAVIRLRSTEKSWSNKIKLWDREAGTVAQFSCEQYLCCSAISPKEDMVVVGLADSSVRLLNMQAKEIVTCQGEQLFERDSIKGLAISPHGDVVVASFERHGIVVWDAATGQKLQSFSSNGTCGSIKFSPDGQYILIFDKNNAVQLFDIVKGTYLQELIKSSDSFIEFAQFSPDGQTIFVSATRGGKSTLLTWKEIVIRFTLLPKDIQSILIPYIVKSNLGCEWGLVPREKQSCALDFRGKDSIVIDTYNSSLSAAEIEFVKPLLEVFSDSADKAVVSRLVCSVNNEKILAVKHKKTICSFEDMKQKEFIQLYDATKKELLEPFLVEEGNKIKTLELSSCGNYVIAVFSVFRSSDIVKIWCRGTGKVVAFSCSSVVKCIAISANEKFVLLGLEDGRIQLFDMQGKVIIEIMDWGHSSFVSEQGSIISEVINSAAYVALSSQGDFALALGSSTNTVTVLDTKTGKRLTTFDPGIKCNSISFSPDGYSVLIAGQSMVEGNAPVRLFDSFNGICLQQFLGDRASISCMLAQFSSDGQSFFVVTQDRERFVFEKLLNTNYSYDPLLAVKRTESFKDLKDKTYKQLLYINHLNLSLEHTDDKSSSPKQEEQKDTNQPSLDLNLDVPQQVATTPNQEGQPNRDSGAGHKEEGKEADAKPAGEQSTEERKLSDESSAALSGENSTQAPGAPQSSKKNSFDPNNSTGPCCIQ